MALGTFIKDRVLYYLLVSDTNYISKPRITSVPNNSGAT